MRSSLSFTLCQVKVSGNSNDYRQEESIFAKKIKVMKLLFLRLTVELVPRPDFSNNATHHPRLADPAPSRSACKQVERHRLPCRAAADHSIGDERGRRDVIVGRIGKSERQCEVDVYTI